MKRAALAVWLITASLGVIPAQAKIAGIGGRIQVICSFSHSNFDDAIVHPGQQNSTHEHGYVGSDSANGVSTVASMESSSTSCHENADTSGYWFPLLTSPLGQPCKANRGGHLEGPSPTAPAGQCVYYPVQALVYYNSFAGVHVNMVPEGLKMLAGGDTSDLDVASFNCGKNKPLHSSPIDCAAGLGIRAHVTFPNCIDGTSQVYTDSVCPSGYLQIPNIHYDIQYAANTGGVGWGVDSDFMRGQTDGHTLHADFWQTWSDQSALADLIENCDNAGADCMDVGA